MEKCIIYLKLAHTFEIFQTIKLGEKTYEPQTIDIYETSLIKAYDILFFDLIIFPLRVNRTLE